MASAAETQPAEAPNLLGVVSADTVATSRVPAWLPAGMVAVMKWRWRALSGPTCRVEMPRAMVLRFK